MLETMLSRFACSLPDRVQTVPTWYKYLDGEVSGGRCSPSVTIPDSVIPILMAIFEILLYVGGIVAVVFVIYGGIQYIISQGEPDRIRGARTTIINALVGLVIVILSTAIVNLIARNIG
jgi:hypothetical protein